MAIRERGRDIAAYAIRWAAGGVLPTMVVSGAVASGYHPVAHGGQRAFLASVVVTVVAALGATALTSWISGSAVSTLAAAVVVLAAGHALHVVRLAQAPTAGEPLARAREDFEDAGVAERWQFAAEDGGEVVVQDGRLSIRSRPGVRASVTFPMPTRPAALLAHMPKWWHSLGTGRPALTEELSWTARLRMQNEFFIVAMIDDLLLQSTRYGLHLTVPQVDGSVVGHEVHGAPVADGGDHTWHIVRLEGWVVLRIDDRIVWRGLDPGPFREVHFGEVRTDELHGGELSIDRLDYRLVWEG
ncbi:MAG: hypothetical protein CL878_13735 [Dehalococcoidia bacterium]|nr:hypothetical protein [Dehalococcoidia bacterium]